MKPLVVYKDYRLFLRDFYREKKKFHYCYSFRLFSRVAGFASPNFLKLVMDGRRNISRDSIPKFGKALKLTPTEIEYFEHLVFWNQGKSDYEKTYHAKMLDQCKESILTDRTPVAAASPVPGGTVAMPVRVAQDEESGLKPTGTY